MGAIWLLSMPDVLRDAGLEVNVYPGWATRSRSSGGYDSVLAVQCHHTASFTSPANDMNYMWNTSPVKPIGAIYLDRTGKWIVGAAGATNTSGKGGPLTTPNGVIPLDAANRHVISIEAANNGAGEAWPAAQQDSYVKGVAALCKAYGIPTTFPSVHAHHEWTPRKIDPAGSSRFAAGANKWNMTAFRDEVTKLSTPQPLPQPSGYTRIAMTNGFEFASAPRWDTRGFGNPLPAGEYEVSLAGAAGKAGAKVNLAVLSAPYAGFATVWPGTAGRPNTSALNYPAAAAIANQVDVPLSPNGTFKVFISTPGHIIFDLVGYWLA